jgi:penicillin amidase
MEKIRIIILGLILSALIFICQMPIESKGGALPPLGAFTSPFVGFWQNTKAELKDPNLQLDHENLIAPVDIILDDRLVPYIFAENEFDAALAQGFLHAKYRMWQVDISLRDISGKLSEVLGERTLERDLETRRDGFVWAAEEHLRLYEQNPYFIKVCDAYLAGYNSVIEKLTYADYPLEYKLLNYTPAILTRLDMVLLSKNLARTLTTKQDDIANHRLYDLLGEELFNLLFPIIQPDISPIHPGYGTHSAKISVTKPEFSLNMENGWGIKNIENAQNEMHLGSNNWAVSSQKSATGNPILCNDPHLNLTLPSIWYELAIITPEYKARGVGLAGLPSVIIGFNEHIAWGVTNGGHDVLDYLAIQWEDEKNGTYLYDGQPMTAQTRIEKIEVKGKPAVIDTVRYTIWGPVSIRKDKAGVDLAMHWTSHKAIHTDEILTFHKLNISRNLEEFRAALRTFTAPIQNVVFASVHGDIALQNTGQWPKRTNMSGYFISDGNNPDHSWKELLEYDQIPYTINPERGFVSSANQHSTGPDFPFLYFGSFESYRGRILNRYLDQKTAFSIEDMKKIQASNYSLKAEEALPAMISLIPLDSLTNEQHSALDMMRTWNFEYQANAWQPVLFDTWYEKSNQLTFDEIAHDNKLYNRITEKWVLSYLLRKQPDSAIFDIQSSSEVREKASDILLMAFQKIWDESGLNGNSGNMNWNTFTNPRIRHLGRIDAFSVKLPSGGCKDCLNAMHNGAGPSWKMIVEMSPKGPIAYGIFPGGQSGNPGSRYYDNTVADWASGQYYALTLPSDKNDINTRSVSVTIKPKSK